MSRSDAGAQSWDVVIQDQEESLVDNPYDPFVSCIRQFYCRVVFLSDGCLCVVSVQMFAVSSLCLIPGVAVLIVYLVLVGSWV
jgi:hypothetical protein